MSTAMIIKSSVEAVLTTKVRLPRRIFVEVSSRGHIITAWSEEQVGDAERSPDGFFVAYELVHPILQRDVPLEGP